MTWDNPALDRLLAVPAYGLSDAEKNSLFLDAISTEMLFHQRQSELFRRLIATQPHDFSGVQSIDELPFIPTQLFKQIGGKLKSVADHQLTGRLLSSATSGQASEVVLDALTSRRQVKALANILADRFGKTRRPFLIVDLDPRLHPSLGARAAAVKGFLNFASDAIYLMSETRDGLALDHESLLTHVRALPPGQPVILFGFTYVLYKQLIEWLMKEEIKLTLPAGSFVVHIGGWKKLIQEAVDRPIFARHVAAVLGITEEQLVDVYGFTEQMGVIYPDCECGWKHCSSIAELLVRDPIDLTLVDDGETGLLQFLTPIPHSYPGNSVLTDDIGFVAPKEEPACQRRQGKRFRIVGRAPRTEVRGCGDIMADKVVSARTERQAVGASAIQLLYPEPRQSIDMGLLQTKLVHLRESQQWLAEQPVDDLIGFFDQLSQQWRQDPPALLDGRVEGLTFLTTWFSSSNLKQITDRALGQRGYLDQFCPANAGVSLQRAFPRGLVIHWLSGNVPLLGLLVWVQSVLAKNINVLKLSQTQSDALPQLFSLIERTVYRGRNGRCIDGISLLRTVLLIYVDRDQHDAATLLSTSADCRIAWGGAEAVQTIMSLPKRYDAVDIVFGPKVSMAIIGRELLNDDRHTHRVLRGIAVDASVFDQTACASPHTIFVESGGIVSPRDFAERLAREMSAASERLPSARQVPATSIETRRQIAQLNGEFYGSADRRWTVVFSQERRLADPIGGRIVTVVPVADIHDAIPLVDRDIQTVGLGVKGERRLSFAAAAASRGAIRFPEIGMMTHFEDPWDGVQVLQQLVRWATIRGGTQ